MQKFETVRRALKNIPQHQLFCGTKRNELWGIIILVLVRWSGWVQIINPDKADWG
jgi:hypothetical protein